MAFIKNFKNEAGGVFNDHSQTINVQQIKEEKIENSVKQEKSDINGKLEDGTYNPIIRIAKNRKSDFFRVMIAMLREGIFERMSGAELNQTILFEEFGKFFSDDFSNYSNHLQKDYPNPKPEIFESLREHYDDFAEEMRVRREENR